MKRAAHPIVETGTTFTIYNEIGFFSRLSLDCVKPVTCSRFIRINTISGNRGNATLQIVCFELFVNVFFCARKFSNRTTFRVEGHRRTPAASHFSFDLFFSAWFFSVEINYLSIYLAFNVITTSRRSENMPHCLNRVCRYLKTIRYEVIVHIRWLFSQTSATKRYLSVLGRTHLVM